jgi:DNA-binding CsgD family transcriptional regulator
VGHNTASASTLQVIAQEPWPAKLAALSTEALAFRVLLDDHDDEVMIWQLLQERLATAATANIEHWIANGSLLHRLRDLGLRLYPCNALRADPHPYMIATEAVTDALPDLRDRVLPPWTDLPRSLRPPLEQTFTSYSVRFTANPYRHAARLWFDPAAPFTLTSASSDDDPWEAVPDSAPGPDEAALRHVLADHALALLSPEDGFVLRALAERWSGREIARRLGCTPNAVYIRAHNARQELRGAGFVKESDA